MTSTVDSGPNWSTTMQFDSLWRILEAQMIKLYKTSNLWLPPPPPETPIVRPPDGKLSLEWVHNLILIICASKILHKESNCMVVDQLGPESTVAVIGGIHGTVGKVWRKGEDVYKKCLGCFKCLPLTSIIEKYVYTAHDGLFRSTTAYLKKSKGKKKRKMSFNPDELSITLSLGTFEELNKAQRMVLERKQVPYH
ncbi:hypothetical protein ACFX1Q_039169 [Malus domestica]